MPIVTYDIVKIPARLQNISVIIVRNICKNISPLRYHRNYLRNKGDDSKVTLRS